MTALRITRVEKAFDFQPELNPATTMYSPFITSNRDGEVTALAMGGRIDAPTPSDPLDRRHFADEIFRLNPSNPFAEPESIINHRSFAWMQDRAFITANPQAFVGSVGGPCITRLGNEDHILFTGSACDPNNCTEFGPANVHGSCTEPWPRDVVFHAIVKDGGPAELQNTGNAHPNVAMQHALVYYDPLPGETGGDSKFKGLDHVAGAVEMPNKDTLGPDWLYVWLNMWTSGFIDPPGSTKKWWQRNVLVRTNVRHSEVWNGSGWERYLNGKLHAWVNTSFRGNPHFLQISHVTRTSFFSREDNREHFILLATVGNAIWYALSDDAMNWTPPVPIASDSPALNGKGSARVMNAKWTQFGDGSCAIYYASNDQNGDGVADVPGKVYEGSCIMRADLELS